MVRDLFFFIAKKATTPATSATPTTPPTTPPAIAPAFELLPEDDELEVLEVDAELVRDAEGADVAVDWGLDAVDSGLSERYDEYYVQWLYTWQLTADRLSKRYVEPIVGLEKNPQHQW